MLGRRSWSKRRACEQAFLRGGADAGLDQQRVGEGIGLNSSRRDRFAITAVEMYVGDPDPDERQEAVRKAEEHHEHRVLTGEVDHPPSCVPRRDMAKLMA